MKEHDPLLQAVQDKDIAAVEHAIATQHDSTAPGLPHTLARLVVRASWDGDLEIVQMLVAKGVGQAYLDEALCAAAHMDHTEVVAELLREGAQLAPFHSVQWTAWHYAAVQGSVRAMELLPRSGDALNTMSAAGMTPVVLALRHEQQAAVKWLLDHGADPQAGVGDGLTLLHLAAKHGSMGPLRQLLDAGVAADVTGPGSLTPLCLAAAMGQQDAVAALLAGGANVNGVSPGVPPVWLAAAGGHVEVVLQLLAAEADVSLVLHALQPDALQALHVAGVNVTALMACVGGNAVHVAASAGHHNVIAALLDHVTGDAQQSLIHCVIPETGDATERFARMLRFLHGPKAPHEPAAPGTGAPPDVDAEEGATPLHLACRQGHKLCVMALLDRGADLNAVTAAGNTVLRVAVCSGSAELVAELVRRGADMHADGLNMFGERTSSAWRAAAEQGHVGAMEAMLPSVGNIDALSAGGRTGLHTACALGQDQAAMLLLSRGANPRAVTSCGCTVLESAARRCSEQTVAALLDGGAVLTHGAWFAAVHAQQLRVVSLFLSRGADINATDSHGQTALQRVCSWCQDETLLVLLAHAQEAGVTLQGTTEALLKAIPRCSNAVVSALLQQGARMHAALPIERSVWHEVARRGLTEKLQLLLDAGAQVNVATGSDRVTALHLASSEGHADAVALLIKAGADVHAAQRKGHQLLSALHLALLGNNMRVMSILLDHGALMQSLPKDHCNVSTVWLTAAELGHVAAIQLMLERGALVDAVGPKGMTALQTACRCARTDAAVLLLAAGANPNAASADGCTALHYASRIECVEALVAAGADVCAMAEDGSTPLLCAARGECTAVVQYLLEKGAIPTAARKDGLTPLHAAVEWAHLEVVQLLLAAVRKGSSISGVSSSGGGSGLHSSAEHELGAAAVSHTIQEVLDAKAADGETPLHTLMKRVSWYWRVGDTAATASSSEYNKPSDCQKVLDTALLLLAEGADAQAVTSKGVTVLQLAACSSCVPLLEVLLARGADVNATASDGSTPLLYAVLNCRLAAVEWLLSRGANPLVAYTQGMTVLHTAAHVGWYKGVKLLLGAVRSSAATTSSTTTFSNAAHQLGGAALSARMQGFLEARTAAGQTALHLAMGQAWDRGPLETAAAAAGAFDVFGAGAACCTWDNETVVLLLEAGADVHAVTDNGSTPLFYAVLSRDKDGLQCLLGHGASPLATRQDGFTALHAAVASRWLTGVQLLLDAVRGCDVSSSRVCSTAARPLGAPAVGSKLQGFLDARTAAGLTALHLALRLPRGRSGCSYTCPKLLPVLLEAGANVNVLHGKPWWPELTDGRYPDGWEMVSLVPQLCEFGGDPDLPWPPEAPGSGSLLHWAALPGRYEHVAQLVRVGADTAALDAEGATPWQVRKQHGSGGQHLVPLLVTAASVESVGNDQTTTQLALGSEESLLTQSIKAVAATWAAPGSVPPQLLEAASCKDVAQAAQLIRQGLARCRPAASQQQQQPQQGLASQCAPASRQRQQQQPQQQQQPVMATQQVALEHATRVAVARSTAAAAAFLGGVMEVLGMQRCVSLLQGLLPACKPEGTVQSSSKEEQSSPEGEQDPGAAVQDPAVEAQRLQQEVFVQRLSLAVLQAWLPEQRWRQERACKLQRLVPAAQSGTMGSTGLVADASEVQREEAMQHVILAAIQAASAGQVADAGAQLVGLAEGGADSTARAIRRMLREMTSNQRVSLCHALVASWQLGARRWLGALRESVLAAVQAS